MIKYFLKKQQQQQMAKEENKLKIKINVEKGSQKIGKDKEIKKRDISKKFLTGNNILLIIILN